MRLFLSDQLIFRAAGWRRCAIMGIITMFAVGAPRAAEYTYTNNYYGTPYTNSIYFDGTLPAGQVRGVVVSFNYGATVYYNAAWRNFAKDRRLALLLMLNQDTLGVPAYIPDGLAILSNTLASVASDCGHAELVANTLPMVFLGVSRGGTSGAINFGWALGANRTVACLAYHGDSFNYLTSPSAAAARAIPVLYSMAQNDSGPYRQTDIETSVRTRNPTTLKGTIPATVFGFRPADGLFWTTTIQYAASHASTGDDTYPLQWLGRVWDLRYNSTTPGMLNTITNANCLGATYKLLNGASSSAYFAACTTIGFQQQDTNIWIPVTGASEWVAASALPQTGVVLNIDSAFASIYIAPENILGRNFINQGTILFTGAGIIGLDNSGGGNPDYFAMTGGTLILQNGVTLRNGANQGGVWTNNLASLSIDATSTFDLWNGNPVYVDALKGAGNVIISLNTGVNWAGARSLTVGVNNGSGTFSGLINGNASSDGGALSLTKVGAGIQLLSGICHYSGPTLIQAGTLGLSGTNNATSSLEVASNAAFQLVGGVVAGGRLHVAAGGNLSGYGVVSNLVVNDGTLFVTNGVLRLTGMVTNNGTMCFAGGALLLASNSTFINNGVLDLMTGAQTLPAKFVNHGTVLLRSAIQIKQASLGSAGFHASIQGYPGHDYQLQRADALQPGSGWTNVAPLQTGTGSVLTFNDFNLGGGARAFYRIVVTP